MKYLVYTFRTYSLISELQEKFENVFVLDKIKNDIEMLCQKIEKEKPNYILGIANSNSVSTIEKYCINKFHKKGKVDDCEIEKFELYIPTSIDFEVRKTPTTSFCNYSMFKIRYFLNEQKLKIPFIFIHVNKYDLERLQDYFIKARSRKEQS